MLTYCEFVVSLKLKAMHKRSTDTFGCNSSGAFWALHIRDCNWGRMKKKQKKTHSTVGRNSLKKHYSASAPSICILMVLSGHNFNPLWLSSRVCHTQRLWVIFARGDHLRCFAAKTSRGQITLMVRQPNKRKKSPAKIMAGFLKCYLIKTGWKN